MIGEATSTPQRDSGSPAHASALGVGIRTAALWWWAGGRTLERDASKAKYFSFEHQRFHQFSRELIGSS